MDRSVRFAIRILTALWVLASSSPAHACPSCSSAFDLDAHLCGFPEKIQKGEGCGGTLKHCQKPELFNPRIQIFSTGSGSYEARLAVEVRAPWNSDPDVLSSGRLKLYWAQGPVPTRFTTNWCLDGTTDRQETYIARGGLTCGDAPYDLGILSLLATTCEGRGGCEQSASLAGLSFQVPKSMLCEEPPKWSCCGDGGCRDCVQVGAGSASPAGEGASASPPMSGPGAQLRYRAGGAGGPGWPGTAAWNQVLGRYWSHDYAERIVPDPDAGHVWLLTRHATFREFTDADADGIYEKVSPSDEYRNLLKVPSGWELRGLDGSVQSFDTAGLWTRTVDRNGNEKVAQYTAGALTRVTFPDGRREDFNYWPDAKLHTLAEVGVDGTTSRTWIYTWSGLDLIRIDRPDGTAWELFYGDPDLPGYLTRIDLRGVGAGLGRVETAWEYDDRGNVVKIWRGDPVSSGPSAVDVHALSFDTPVLPTRTQVTDAVGKTSVYYLGRDSVSRKPRLTRLESGCASCGMEAQARYEYNDASHPLLPTLETDGRGNRTVYTYNGDGRPVSRIEAAGASLAREIGWEYHPLFRSFPIRITRPSVAGGSLLRETVLSYDAEGNLLTRTENGRENGSPFALTTEMTYNDGGQILTIDPPGHGTADVTSFTYDATRGNGNLVPLSRTDPLVGTTLFTHDALNRRTGVTDVNGVLTVTTYDDLSRVTAIVQDGGTAAGLTTFYQYTPFGDLFRTTLPEGNVTEYGYDGAGRSISTERKPDAATPGERVLYTLDGMGRRAREDLQRRDGIGWATESWTGYVYSACHLDKVERPGGSVTEYAYDCQGNLEKVWDANHPRASYPAAPTWTYTYDALHRLVKASQPWAGAGGGMAETLYGYDIQDHLAKVTDAEGNATTYTYGDRDLLTREESPVSGVTAYTYDEHGERVTETDARGVTVTRSYDALDRVTVLSYPDPSLDVAYTYDSPGLFAKGRPTGISRHGETVVYEYDRFGRLTRDGDLTYAYDGNGNRTAVGYPGAVTAEYTYDHADRQKTLSATIGEGSPFTLVSDAAYKPFGPLASLSLGNGVTETRSFDERYVPSEIRADGTGSLLHWSYTTDPVGNIKTIADQLDPGNSRTYGYQDVSYFLTQGDGPWGPRAWTYDKIGNRLTETRGTETDVYTYPANPAGGNNPRLLSVGERSYAYDESGNTAQVVSGDEQVDLIHDAAGRLAFLRSLPGEEVASFTYDGRSFLRDASQDEAACMARQTIPTYSSEGLLHGREHRNRADAAFLESSSVFSFAGRPVADLKLTESGSTLIYLTTDHLGTPVLATDEAGGVIWKGGFEPFGEDWSGAGAAGVFLRLPGQWVDGSWAAGEMHYNVHRWYRPESATYSQPDPVDQAVEAFTLRIAIQPDGLYSYARQRPLVMVDPLGLKAESPAACIVRWTALGATAGMVAGGTVGGVGGGAGCTLLAPGVGTVGCGAAGATVGTAKGATVGSTLGALVGTIVCSCEETDKNRENIDCKKVRQLCIDMCTETLPTGTLDGAPFFRCLRRCLNSFGC